LRKEKSRINKESKMKKLFLTISVAIFISACGGGGGYGSSSPTYVPPTTTSNVQGLVPPQIDPVQTTEN
tara:strand:+ start:201 stop:407 length:207 start_codon:yes stop_codon:yes gene_type:complete